MCERESGDHKYIWTYVPKERLIEPTKHNRKNCKTKKAEKTYLINHLNLLERNGWSITDILEFPCPEKKIFNIFFS